MPFIASTMTSDVKYTRWTCNPGGINVARPVTDGKSFVLIKGGHGVAQKLPHGGLITPNGVVTQVTDEELSFLKSDEVFQTHLKGGFIKILEQKAEPSPEKAIKDMETEDKSAPLKDKDFKKGGRAAGPESLKVNGGKKLQ